MRQLNPPTHPDLLVGALTGDDAAVWRLDDDRALVATADFITPVVDDARAWGRVAAANSVSDVYAMGGRPLFALNLVGWNTDELSADLLGEVLAGGAEIAAEAGFIVAGGHTVDDPEPKYGMAVIGEAHPDRLLTNAGLRAGDVLVVTKPLGIGIITTGIKRGLASAAQADAAIASMTKLNAHAAQVALAAGATGATDITGFGFLGHVGRMALESGVDVAIDVAALPVLDGVRDLAEAGSVPGGTGRNREAIEAQVEQGAATDLDVTILADAQTSGGLAFGVAPERAADAVAELVDAGHQAAVVAEVITSKGTAGTGRLLLR